MEIILIIVAIVILSIFAAFIQAKGSDGNKKERKPYDDSHMWLNTNNQSNISRNNDTNYSDNSNNSDNSSYCDNSSYSSYGSDYCD